MKPLPLCSPKGVCSWRLELSSDRANWCHSQDGQRASTERRGKLRRSNRRKVERRRQIDPTTCERDYRPDEVEFMTAMDDYKRRSGRMFPTWSEVLEVIRDLGYRKVAQPTQTYEAVAT